MRGDDVSTKSTPTARLASIIMSMVIVAVTLSEGGVTGGSPADESALLGSRADTSPCGLEEFS